MFLRPPVVNVSEHAPTPFARVVVQLSPVLAAIVTVPFGTPFPVTVTLARTRSPTFEGFGANEPSEVALAASFAVVESLSVAALKFVSAAQLATTWQVPVPLVIVTAVPLFAQAP